MSSPTYTNCNHPGACRGRVRSDAFPALFCTNSSIGAFDDHVESAMSDGLFTGDDRALDAVKEARAAYSQHRQLFRSQGAGDDVGRTMEKIIGRNGGEGATPTEVANYLYGQAKVGGTGLSVRLALRMQNVLGADSPEWSAIRQGLWSRLSEATEGTTEFLHGLDENDPRKKRRPRCGCRTRAGGECQMRVEWRKSTCRLRGGAPGSGQQTPEGRKRIGDAQRRRWAAWREAKSVESTA